MVELAQFSVVGCSECGGLWIVDELHFAQTAECRHCGTAHSTDNLRALAKGDDLDVVRELRSRILAERAGYAEEYGEMDDYAILEEQAEESVSRFDDVFGELDTETDTKPEFERLCEILVEECESNQTETEQFYETLAEESVDAFQKATDYQEHTEDLGVSLDEQLERYYDHDEKVTVESINDTEERAVAASTDETGDLQFSTAVDEFADVVVDDPTNTSDLHEELFATDSPVQDRLLDAAEDLAADIDGDHQQFLETVDELASEYPEDSAGGAFRSLLVHALDGGNAYRVKKLVSQLGNNTYLDLRTGLIDVYSGPFAVFRGSDVTRKVVVRLTSDLFDTDTVSRSTRENVVEYLTELARGCEVRVVATGLVQTRLLQEHREMLPASVIESSIARATGTALSDDAKRLAMDALANINYGNSAWDVLHVICEGRHDTAWYSDLYDDARLNFGRTRISQCISLLEEHELIITEGPQNDKYAIATPAGTAALDALEAQIGKQAELDSFDESQDGGDSEAGVSETPESYSDSCTPTASGQGGSPAGDASPSGTVGSGGHGSPPASAPDSLPPAVEAGDEHRQYSSGFAPVETLAPWEHHAAVAAAPAGGVGFDDVPVGGVNWQAFSEWSVDRIEDKRSPIYSYDADQDELVAGGEFHTPFQYGVTLARALLSPLAFNQVLTPERLDGKKGELNALVDGNKEILRDKRCLGWLKDSHSGEEYHEALQEGVEELETLLRKIENGNYDDEQRELRRETLQLAHGLIGTAVGIYDLLDVDVNRLVRIPGRVSSTMDADDRRELCHFLVRAATISSKMGAYTQSRVQFEPREDKRKAIGDAPAVDKDDPTGTHIGQWSVVGYGTSTLQEDVEDAFENPDQFGLELQADEDNFAAFGVNIPLDVSFRRTNIADVVRRSLSDRSMRMTRHAVSVMQAFTGSVHDVAKALFHLGSENGRKVRVDDLKYALSNLPASRILPSTNGSTKSKIVHTLITSAFPLPQSELCDRAGVSKASFAGWGTSKSHRDELEAFGVIRETDAGWVVTLSYDALEDQDLDGDVDEKADALPWYATIDEDAHSTDRRGDRNGREATLEGAVYEAMLVLESVSESDVAADSTDGSLSGILSLADLVDLADEEPALEPMFNFVAALREHDSFDVDSPPDDDSCINSTAKQRVATLGCSPEQSGLGTFDDAVTAVADD